MLILVNAPLSLRQEDRIRNLSARIRLTRVDPARGLDGDSLREAEVLFTTGADFQPSEAPCLRWVQLNTAAVDGVLNQPIAGTEVQIANVKGAYSVAVAECAIGMLLALTRRFPLASEFQSQRRWPQDYSPFLGEDLFGGTMGIVGYGSIGRQIGKLAQALGMKVLACKRTPDDKRDTGYCIPGTGDPEGRIPEAWFGTHELALMMSRYDVVVINLPLTPATIGLVGKRDLDSLPPHAYVVNVGRGAVLSETALIESLRTGRIAGAALDVFELEPLPAESPLWGLPNLLVVPHIASWTRQQSERAGEVLIENLSRDLQGLPLINVIDKSAMY